MTPSETSRFRNVAAPGAGIGGSDGGKLDAFDEIDFFQRRGQRHGDGGPGGADVLEGRGGGQAGCLLQLGDELPAVQRVEEVDVAGLAVQDFEGQRAVLHKDAGRLLVRVAAVFQCEFVHCDPPV